MTGPIAANAGSARQGEATSANSGWNPYYRGDIVSLDQKPAWSI